MNKQISISIGANELKLETASEHRRHFEVAAGLVRNLAALNKDSTAHQDEPHDVM